MEDLRKPCLCVLCMDANRWIAKPWVQLDGEPYTEEQTALREYYESFTYTTPKQVSFEGRYFLEYCRQYLARFGYIASNIAMEDLFKYCYQGRRPKVLSKMYLYGIAKYIQFRKCTDPSPPSAWHLFITRSQNLWCVLDNANKHYKKKLCGFEDYYREVLVIADQFGFRDESILQTRPGGVELHGDSGKGHRVLSTEDPNFGQAFPANEVSPEWQGTNAQKNLSRRVDAVVENIGGQDIYFALPGVPPSIMRTTTGRIGPLSEEESGAMSLQHPCAPLTHTDSHPPSNEQEGSEQAQVRSDASPAYPSSEDAEYADLIYVYGPARSASRASSVCTESSQTGAISEQQVSSPDSDSPEYLVNTA
ncbi:hypothetical protein FQN55_002474 [Onygenales sp. PD_40]|nr:hypothetical protein FQN55_002474 [Onygenales sp. PD_40]